MTQQARELIKGPALGIKITAVAIAVVAVAGPVLGAIGVGTSVAEGDENTLPALMSGNVQIAASLFQIAEAVFLWIVAGKMARLESYSLCLVGAILVMLPCTLCCIIGLPIGIWALVVLAKPEVKQAFGVT